MTLTFTLASLNFMFLFGLRSAYSFVKPLFKQHYQLSNLFLSLMDLSLFFGIAFGYLIKYWLVNDKNSTKYYKIAVVSLFIFNLFLAITPRFYKVNSHYVKMFLIGSIFCIGLPLCYFQSFLVANLKKSYLNGNRDLVIAFWSASGHIGKALGVFMMTFLISQAKFSWEMSHFSINALAFLTNCFGYLHLGSNILQIQPSNQLQHNHQQLENQSNKITMQQFIKFIMIFLKNKLARPYIILACLYKGLAQNFLLWLPVYLTGYNYSQFIGISTFVFVFPIILGSFVIGWFFQNETDRTHRIAKSTSFLFAASVLTVLGLVTLVHWSLNYLQFIVIITLLGIVINGFYNVLLISEDFSISLSQREKEMMWNFVKASTNFGIGIIDISVGIYLELVGLMNKKQKKNPDAIFNLFLIVSLLAQLVFVDWYWNFKQRAERPQNNERNELEEIQV